MEKIVANPFQAGGRLRDPKHFVGRDRELRQILSRVANMDNVSVVGPRRIGKSSSHQFGALRVARRQLERRDPMNKKRQARGAPRSSAAPAQTANPITLSFTSPLKLQFDSNSQLQVTVVTPEKPPAPLNRSMRFLIIGVFLIALLWLFLWMRYLTLSFPQSAEFNDASLSIALAHPAYVAYGDEAEMELTVTNRGGQNFTGSVTVNFPGGVPVRPLASETTTIKIEKLSANASVTHRLKFALRQQTRLFSGEVIPTRLQIATHDRSFQPIAGPQIAIAPLPFLRTINSWLGNSVVLAAVAALL